MMVKEIKMDRKCIACGALFKPVRTITARDYSSGNTIYPVDFCPCGLGVTRINDQRESDAVNKSSYDNLTGRIDIYFNRLKKHFYKRHSEILGNIRKFSPGGKALLEVGSNLGYTAHMAVEKGYDVVACELNDRCRNFSELVFGLTVSKDLYKVKNRFDIVTLNDVLEHFPEPVRAIRKIHTLLVHDGIVFIQLPNWESSVAERHGGEWHWYNPPDHLFHFNINSMKKFLAGNGFSLLWMRTVDMAEDLPLFRLFPGRLKGRIFQVINYFFSVGLIENKKERGGLIQLIAKKNDD